jgi:ribosome-associated translation inhibitor RaiA
MSQSPKRVPVATVVPRPKRRVSGRTSAASTPLALRSAGVEMAPELREHILSRLGFRLGKFARHIERLTVRFEDVNGPRGGVDTVCRIKVVLSGNASVIVEELASGPFEAFNRADDRVERAVRRAIGRAQGRGRLRGVRAPEREVAKPRAAKRSAPTSASTSTSTSTSRNFKRRTRGATAALEETSATGRRSRKSTRGSANRARQGNKLSQRQTRRVSSPKARKSQSKSPPKSRSKKM